MPQIPLSLSPSTQALKDSLKALDCYDAYQALNHPYSSKEVDTKHHILVIAICLINEKGFETLNMNHVVDHSAVSRRTVYKYFTNKESLATDIAILWAVHAQLHIPMADSRMGFIESVIEHALEYPQVLKAVSAGIAYPSTQSVGVYHGLETKIIQTLDKIGQQSVSDKTKKQTKIAYKTLVQSLIYHLIVLANQPQKKANAIQHLHDIIRLFDLKKS